MNGRRLGVAAVLLSAISFTSVASADETQCAIDVMGGVDLMETGRLVEADDALRSAGPDCAAARERSADLAWRIPKVFLHVAGRPLTDVTVLVDGSVVDPARLGSAQRLNPGGHVFLVRTKDGAERHVSFVLSEGDVKSFVVDFEAGRIVPADRPVESKTSTSSISPIAWGGFGLAAIGLAVGTGTALVSMSKVRDIQESCVESRCPPSERGDIETAKTYSTISTVAFVGAAVGAGIGVLGLTLWKESPKRETSARVNVGPGSVGVVGSF